MSKPFLFQAIKSSQTVLIKTEFRLSIVFVSAQLNAKTILFQTNQFSVSTVSMSKTVLFQTIMFSMQKQLHFKHTV